MNSAKVALSIPAELIEQARAEVATGKAKNLSVFVSEALDQRLRRDELSAILDAMDAEYGPPNKAASAWAKRVVGR
jgi:Arc/MetJ-type ribon-helix-helix transcriptional regulator